MALAGYSGRKKITVQAANLDAELSGFPLLVKITADADIGAACLATGYDVRFTAADGETELPFDRRYFAVAAGEATGVFIVLSDVDPDPATEIYVYWGKADATDASDPATVWAGYKGVYPLDEAYNTDAGGYRDVSPGNHDATLTDADADSAQADGPIYKAVDLSGDADYLSVADHADHDPGGAMTVGIWFKTSEDWADLIHHGSNDLNGPGWFLEIRDLIGGHYSVRARIGTATGTTELRTLADFTPGEWQHVLVTYDKSLGSARIKLYLNGAPTNQADGYNEDIGANASGIVMGVNDWGKLDGALAEVRYLPGVALSADWIKFEYHNIAEADNELTWGAAEDLSEPEEPPAPEPAPTLTYADFVPISAGVIHSVNWTDHRFTLAFRDLRASAYINLPEETYTTDVFPRADTSIIGQPRKAYYGTHTNALARMIDTTYHVFEISNSRVKAVSEVRHNDVALAEGTDYYVDYQRGRITLDESIGATWTSGDKIEVDFTGICNTADEAMTTGADIFIDLCTRYLGLGVSDLGMDETYRTRTLATETLALEVSGASRDLLRKIERSIGAMSFQDAEGRIGLRVSPSTAPGDVLYLEDRHIFGIKAVRSAEAIYSAVVVKYAMDPQTGDYSQVVRSIARVGYEHGKQPQLEIETALTSASDALARANEIIAALEKQSVTIEAQRLLLNRFPGDVFYLTRDRYPSQSGVASNVLMRIMGIDKALGDNKTTITAEEV